MNDILINAGLLTVSEIEHLVKQETLTFKYRNWKGVNGTRLIGQPMTIEYKTSPYYENAGLFLTAFDLNKQEYRDFLLSRMLINPTQQG